MGQLIDRLFFKRFRQFIQEGPVEDFSNIIDLPVDQFVEKFKDIADDPAVHALIKAGTQDGKPTDEVVRFTSTNIPVTKLKPTQNEIGMAESLQNILTDKYNNVDMILRGGNVVIKAPILILNNEWIIDGHHRWSQVYVCNPDCAIKAINMTASIKPQDALKAVQMAIVAASEELPLSSAKGINLLTASATAIHRFIMKNGTTEVANQFFNAKKIQQPTLKFLADRITRNVLQMQQGSKPMTGAPDRDFMPQTDNAPEFIKYLEKGMVNFIEPKPTDI